MAYLERKPIAEVDPAHPFARSQISFVSKPPQDSSTPSETPSLNSAESRQEAYIQKLIASKPMRKDFKSQDDFEESYGYWMGHQGRIISLYQQSRSKDFIEK